MANSKLIIVESPTKAKTITKFLGTDSNCKVLASNGHIRTLPKEGLCIDVKNGYQPEYIEDPTKAKVVEQLKSELKKADELILATDEDREGESISWHLLEVLKPQIPYRRMVFHEITKKAILEAFENGKDLDMNMVHAQEARRVLDRLYGYSISPVLWSKLSNKTLSAGRVQSPGLRLIVDRERERLNHKKTEYRDIKVKFNNGLEAKLDSYNGKKIATGKDFDSITGAFNASSKTLLLNYETSKIITDDLKECSFTVTDIKEREIVEKPAPPFTTSTLQQEGNRKLHLAAKDTMKIAQSLYENGFITYMRTDNTALSEEGTKGARNAAVDLFGQSFITDYPRHYSANSENAQEAHEAIRPAGEVFQKPEETGLSGRELLLYKMIFNRTLASQMKDAVKQSTTVLIAAKSGTTDALLSASGTRIEFPGFIKVYVEGRDEETVSEDNEALLPKMSTGLELKQAGIESNVHETKAPNRYTEASLVQELEKRGIGRPSTYASIIDRIVEKQYVIKDRDSLVPTFTGFGVVQLLEGYFKNRIDYGFTSQMEKDLDQIAQGKVKELEYLKNFYEGSEGLVQQIQTVKNQIDAKTVKKLLFPHLKAENVVTLGPYGPYVQTEEGKYASIPDNWTPASVTDELIENLKKGTSTVGGGSLAPAVVGTSPDGQPILYCTGRYGDYWQIGNRAETENVRRYKVPAYLKGKTVSAEHIMDFFNLPKYIGKDDNGNDIIADIGRYGAYLKCNDDYRNIKDPEEIFVTTELEARKIFAEPKASSKKTGTKTAKTYKKTAKSKTDDAATIVKTFGEYEGQMLTIRSGRYGFYLKHGNDNYRIPAKYQHDEEACKGMSPSEALTYLKK